MDASRQETFPSGRNVWILGVVYVFPPIGWTVSRESSRVRKRRSDDDD
jgi:hypothetical protein